MKKTPLFKRHNAGPPTHATAFSGRGVVPDVMSEHAATTLPAASKTTLEHGVHGVDGMMPVPGLLGRVSKGQAPDAGAAGAGSFATRAAKGAKG